jgi:hypothetical protein
MKLKLETQDAVTVLVVTEAVETSHIPILKAGLAKLFQTGKKTILLDFSQVAEKDFKDPSLFQQIAELRGWSQLSDAQVIVVSAIQNLGHAPSREAGIQLLSSPVGQLQALESKLQAEYKMLEAKKAALQQKVGASTTDDQKKLLAENSRLKKEIAQTEKLCRKFLKSRNKDPFQLPAMQVSQENLGKLVDSFLKTEGVLK